MNVVVCPRCDQTMIIDEYRTHECKNDFRGVRTIMIRDYHGKTLDKNGDEVLLADGENGKLYRLVKCSHKIPHNLPHQPTVNTDNDQPSSYQNRFYFYNKHYFFS